MEIEYIFCDDRNIPRFDVTDTTPEEALLAAVDYLGRTKSKYYGGASD